MPNAGSQPPAPSASGYVELHCHTNYSLLDGASHPDELAERARELGMPALAVTDHDGLYGVVRFAKACRAAGVKPIVGAELTLESGHHVVLLARNAAGYSSLCRLISTAQLASSKGKARLPFDALAERPSGLVCLSGCREGEVAANLLARRFPEALAAAGRYLEVFGRDAFWIELQRHRRPDDRWLCAALARLATKLGVGCVATNDVHYHVPERRRLQDVLVCIRTHTSLDQSHSLRRPNAEYHLKSGQEMAELFRDYPEAVANAGRIAEQCSVDLSLGAYRFPAFDLPPGETAFSYLYQLCHQGARERYRPLTPRVLAQLAHELDVIEKLGLSEYFLIVWDIVRFARERGILAQGRGSAANSIVAYCLGITNVDPIKLDLLFERFLSEERAGTPDVDVDFANSRREEVIQYVYQKYGADHTAMVCTVITFQGRSAVRDVGKALGLPLGLLDRVAKSLDHHGATRVEKEVVEAPEFAAAAKGYQWQQLFELCKEIDGFPRHLSIHVGGMLITARPLVEIVPLERATMPGRVVCQYDKDDVEELGLVKIDLLGLGMLALIQDCLKLIERHRGVKIDLATLPLDDPKVYDMLCRGDAVGVFQVESRAQMATLPRLRPRTFYDIVTEIAIIRPGPIQGRVVHPFVQRRLGREPVTYLHPCLEPILKKTMGIVLFQEQVIRIGMVVAGFTPGEADLLRRAMGGDRSDEKMRRLRQIFVAGAVARGIDVSTAEGIFQQIEAFVVATSSPRAAYGFPESHAAAFAKIAYDSAYLKLYYAPEFYCALLNNWPMGFYHPSVVIGDARRHGVRVLPIDVNRSRADCTVEEEPNPPIPPSGRSGPHRPRGKGEERPGVRTVHPLPLIEGRSEGSSGVEGLGQPLRIRLGYRYARGVGEVALARLDAAATAGPYASLEEFCRRTRLEREAVENLIAVGAFDCLSVPRRQLLWQLPEALQAARDGELPDLRILGHQVDLPPLAPLEEAQSDYFVLGLSTAYHVMDFYRCHLDGRETLRCDELPTQPSGRWVRVAGVVICRQAPPTARGHVFLTLEDETGLCNVTIRPNVYQTYRRAVRHAVVVLVEGVLQSQDGAVSVLARRLEDLRLDDLELPPAREFR